jgi:hypothetical protein
VLSYTRDARFRDVRDEPVPQEQSEPRHLKLIPPFAAQGEHGKRSMRSAMDSLMRTVQTTNTFKHGQEGSQVSTTHTGPHIWLRGEIDPNFSSNPPGPESRGLNTNTNTRCKPNAPSHSDGSQQRTQARTFGSGGRSIRIFHRTPLRARKSRLSKNNRSKSREPRANPNNTSRACSITPNKTGQRDTDSRCATRSRSSSSNALPATL